MKTAIVAKLDQERNRRMFEHMIEAFSKRYRPGDAYEGSEFDAALMSIIRQTIHDAQAPVLEQLGKLAEATVLVQGLAPKAK